MSSVGRAATKQRPGGFVFADPGGRRWRILRVLAAGIALALVGLTMVGLNASTASPWRTGKFVMDALTGSETAPVVGSGPAERVLAVERTASGEVWGVDPDSGDQVASFDAATAARIGNATYVVHRSGYETATGPTLSLTFDDGPDPVATAELLDVLRDNGIRATFFVTGRNVIRYPDLVRRIVAEGHLLGGHTVNHPDLFTMPDWRVSYELVTTDRLVRATTGVAAPLWRMPYDDASDTDVESVGTLVRSQHLGYLHAGYDFDTRDWAVDADPNATASDIPLPDLSTQENFTLLLHDAGGPNRTRTVAYVRDILIPAARSAGYSFTTMAEVNSGLTQGNPVVEPTWADTTALVVTRALYVWPTILMRWLFLVTLGLALAFGLANAALALVRHRRERRAEWPPLDQWPPLPVTVLLAAYNEETVIERTIRTVLRSEYPLTEVLVVDDGSTDGTADIVRRLAEEEPRVRLLQQANQGKSTALNNGLAVARGEVVVTIDADTMAPPSTVSYLVRRFAFDSGGNLGVVAGVVRVGNRGTNIFTRWQALEYVAQIGLERAAQAQLNAIAIVPGACAAWRRSALLAAGGFKTDNLAEDADLALSLHEYGWRVEQDDEAFAFTEAPETLDDLLKQRIRWTYGIMQAMWKHRGLLFSWRHPGLGFYVLPNYALSQVIPFVFLPLTVLITVFTLQSEGPALLAAFFGVFVAYQLILSWVAVALMRESRSHLLMVPIYRLIYEPLRAYLLYATVASAVKGVRVQWNRVRRTGSVDAALVRAPQSPASPIEPARGTLAGRAAAR